jgi:polyketide cyclase/dehydrase/lipid transport protein
MRREDLDFITGAPKRWTFDAPVAATPEVVFDAISADPKTWTWFPGITSGGYEGDGPHGVGSIREARMGPSVYRETILAWEAPSRWVYRVDEMTVPLAHALVEEWRIEEAPGGSVVRWTFAIDPRPLFVASMPLATRAMGKIFRTAMRNLSRALADGATKR